MKMLNNNQNNSKKSKIQKNVKKNINLVIKRAKSFKSKLFSDIPIQRHNENSIREYLRNFCDMTTLHGLKMVTKDGSIFYDRIIWFIIVVISVCVCLALVYISYNWNSETPTIQSIDNTQALLYNFAFPAITICNLNRISKSRAYSLARHFKRSNYNMTDDELAALFRLTLYFFGSLEPYPDTEFEKLKNILVENRYTTAQLIQELTQPCTELLVACMWKGTVENCQALFQQVRTIEGLCCSLNYYGEKENNYPQKFKSDVPPLPRRLTGCSYQMGITVLLYPNVDDYFATYISGHGIRFFVHDSYSYPDENADVKHLTTLQDGNAWIIPKTTYADSNVRHLSVLQRKCLFREENSLHVMKKYTYVNCLAECRSHLIFERCGCVPDNLPRNTTMKVCEIDKAPCFLRYRRIIAAAIPGILNVKDPKQKAPYCNCLPDCQLNQYQLDVTSQTINRKYSLNYANLFKGVTITEQIFLKVFFNDVVGIRYRLSIFQDWLQILASFGGLVGLVMGFSIVSIFELFFAIVVRPILGRYKL